MERRRCRNRKRRRRRKRKRKKASNLAISHYSNQVLQCLDFFEPFPKFKLRDEDKKNGKKKKKIESKFISLFKSSKLINF